MNPEVKAKWLAALRSGDYKQTTGALCRPSHEPDEPDRYCCLGVLCELYPDKIRKQAPGVTQTLCVYEVPDTSSTYCFGLPPVFAAEAGITEHQEQTVTGLNDDGVPFDEIANWIEENL